MRFFVPYALGTRYPVCCINGDWVAGERGGEGEQIERATVTKREFHRWALQWRGFQCNCTSATKDPRLCYIDLTPPHPLLHVIWVPMYPWLDFQGEGRKGHNFTRDFDWVTPFSFLTVYIHVYAFTYVYARLYIYECTVFRSVTGYRRVVTWESAYCRHCFEVTKQKKCSIRGWHCSQLAEHQGGLRIHASIQTRRSLPSTLHHDIQNAVNMWQHWKNCTRINNRRKFSCRKDWRVSICEFVSRSKFSRGSLCSRAINFSLDLTNSSIFMTLFFFCIHANANWRCLSNNWLFNAFLIIFNHQVLIRQFNFSFLRILVTKVFSANPILSFLQLPPTKALDSLCTKMKTNFFHPCFLSHLHVG